MSDDLQHTALNGTADYIAALDTLCGLAQHSLYVFEKNFEGIGFNSEARYDTLRRFLLANPANRLHLLAHDARPIVQHCPRLTLLLRQFGHSMHIYQTPQHLLHLSEPFAVADESHYVRRFHFDDPRGILAQHDAEGARVLKSRFAEMWASSHPALSATTLGL
ncbi:MAG: hypothetical protein KGJ19_05625 [Betaproteobacteria bacterium]|nr:hypothetical protein [Betaproteobacteria bacterium]